MTRNDLLSAFVPWYAAHSEETLSAAYIEQLATAVRLLEQYVGSQVRLGELSDAVVNGFCDWLRTRGRAVDTVRGRRNSILCLWREAFRSEILDKPPMRIRRIRNHRRLPQAWTREHVQQLVKTAQADRRLLPHGIYRGDWFASIIATGWDTALRLGDLLALPFGTIVPDAPFVVRQHKTGDDVLVSISEHTWSLIQIVYRQGPDRPEVWPLWGRRDAFYVQMRQLVARAEIPAGTFKWLRRSAITQVEASGGNGSTLAGHRSRGVTERHYIDPRLARLQFRPLALVD